MSLSEIVLFPSRNHFYNEESCLVIIEEVRLVGTQTRVKELNTGTLWHRSEHCIRSQRSINIGRQSCESLKSQFTRQELGVRAVAWSQGFNDSASGLFLRDKYGPSIDKRIELEITTDLQERGTGFDNTFYFDIGPEYQLTSVDTAQDLQDILDTSVEVAIKLGSPYHLAREHARQGEPERIQAWLKNGGEGFAMTTSLCPPPTELELEKAKKLNFKQERMMSVISVYSLEAGRLKAEFFSLDNHNLVTQQTILYMLGINRSVEPTALAELEHFDVSQHKDPARAIKDIFRRDRQELDDSKLETAVAMYMKVLDMCSTSEKTGTAGSALIAECLLLGIVMPTEHKLRFGRDASRYVLERLRSESLPGYIYGPNTPANSGDPRSSSEQTLHTASRQTIASGISFAGDCPPGGKVNIESTSNSSSSLLDTLIYGTQLKGVVLELRSRRAGVGPCLACSPNDIRELYGCGVFCKDCNDVSCNELERSGRLLSYDEIRSKRSVRIKIDKRREARRKLAKDRQKHLKAKKSTYWFWPSAPSP